jgi:hypothetical protein
MFHQKSQFMWEKNNFIQFNILIILRYTSNLLLKVQLEFIYIEMFHNLEIVIEGFYNKKLYKIMNCFLERKHL